MRSNLRALSAQRAACIDPNGGDGRMLLPGVSRAGALAGAPEADTALANLHDPEYNKQNRLHSMALIDLAIARQAGERMRQPNAVLSTDRVDDTIDTLKHIWEQRLPGMEKIFEALRPSSREAVTIVEKMQNAYIDEPPDPRLKITVAIPVRGEYDNGNLVRTLDSFASLNTDAHALEIICAVNMAQDEGSRTANLQHDNARALAFAEILRNPSRAIPNDLPNYYREVLQKIREKGLHVHVLDMSTLPLPQSRLVGDIRNELTGEAMHRMQLVDIGKQGIILQWDADTLISAEAIHTLLARQERSKSGEAHAYFLGRDYVQPNADPKVLRSTYAARFNYVLDELRSTLKAGKPRNAGSPQIAANVLAYEKVGGIRTTQAQEDFELTVALTGNPHVRYETVPTAKVFPADRVYAYAATGFDSAFRGIALDGGAKPALGKEVPALLEDAFEHGQRSYGPTLDIMMACAEVLVERAKTQDLTSEELTTVAHELARVGIHETPESLQEFIAALQDGKDAQSVIVNYLRNHARPLEQQYADAQADEWVRLCEAVARPSELRHLTRHIAREVRDSTLRLSTGRKIIRRFVTIAFTTKIPVDIAFIAENTKEKSRNQMVEFARQNSWLLERLRALRTEASSADEAMAILEREYPQQLQQRPVGEVSNARRATARMLGVKAFFQDALTHPDDYPQMQPLIRMFSGARFRELLIATHPQQATAA